ncbi:hypothetical protein SERLA73DRAFT_181097 [Serpula lacrymans var. lacrymans S7.3]|uniref:Short-chain dehydrogenase n=2 Tax=Serpula lacrymans var. lacrymans TaxID=341189 RepID=F8PUS6_SERL3|nr:uncharacterized protein SERLADRAFT_466989 [Serpula lacrymans var. lacrymans S7.9]EGO00484.1 hypothetical protein SERLA73DRAFT_181097 [Serpula lacrymans var. lacrymans S7.3]EGO26034.1 hypothetical protein SERLADRAFT_466989 [Serpula lacrymans var. lacrymans S7.9]
MARWALRRFLREQWTTLPLPLPQDCESLRPKSIVLVGANVGLGFEAAVHLARLKPAQLLLTCRNPDKCEVTKTLVEQRSRSDGVQQESPISLDNIESWPLELDSFESVKAFVAKFEAESRSPNVLVANAGVALNKYTKTQDGWETTLQVNHLSTALLSILMLPHLIRSSTETSQSRLVIVSSEAHYFTKISKLEGPRDCPNILKMLSSESYCTPAVMEDRYNLSKFLEIVFVRELARRLRNGSRLSVCAVHPGFCHSELTRHASLSFRYLVSIGKALFARSTEMGSRTLLHAAAASGEQERHGHYISSCEVVEEHDWLLSETGRKWSDRIWNETISILAHADHRINSIVTEYLVDPGN